MRQKIELVTLKDVSDFTEAVSQIDEEVTLIGKDENGKTKRKSVTAKTKSECQEKLNKAKEEYLKEQSVLSSHTT